MQSARHRVVIIGGGFGGLACAKGLARADADVTLIDRANYHLFQPLLYQVATGGLSPANIASPLRWVLKRQSNTRVILAEAVDIDPQAKTVLLRDGVIEYDTLVLAAGARTSYFGNEDWPLFSPGLKTIEDATEIRRRILLAFEAAEREEDPQQVMHWMTFVIVGGGPTGVELAGAIAEIARDTLRHDFRSINPADARIVLVEGNERVLSTYPAPLSSHAERSLRRLKVELRTNTRVMDVGEESALLRTSDGTEEEISTRTILWAAGVSASPLGAKLAARLGLSVDRGGRVPVAEDCSLPGYPELFVIGDLALFRDEQGEALPGVGGVAQQQGYYVARLLRARLAGLGSIGAFHYVDKGSMATIGRAAAVADLRGLHLHGLPGWLAWLFVHLLLLVEFEDRLTVMLHWTWNYFTRNRSARLITGEDKLPQLRSAGRQPQSAASDESRP